MRFDELCELNKKEGIYPLKMYFSSDKDNHNGNPFIMTAKEKADAFIKKHRLKFYKAHPTIISRLGNLAVDNDTWQLLYFKNKKNKVVLPNIEGEVQSMSNDNFKNLEQYENQILPPVDDIVHLDWNGDYIYSGEEYFNIDGDMVLNDSVKVMDYIKEHYKVQVKYTS